MISNRNIYYHLIIPRFNRSNSDADNETKTSIADTHFSKITIMHL